MATMTMPQAVLTRRPVQSFPSTTKEFTPFRLDTVNQCLWRNADAGGGERVLLTPKAFSVLRYLVDHAGRLVTQDELLGAVWPDTYVQPEVLKYQIADIRGILGDHPKDPLFIETLPRRGYRFMAPVRESASDAPRVSSRPGMFGELRDCLRNALNGERQVVFISGDDGIGKPTLIEEFERQAAADAPGIRIARGQCVEGFGSTEPYYPMLQAVGRLCRGPEGSRIVEILAAQAPTWLVQIPAAMKPEHRELLRQEILGATRQRMLREIGDAIDTIASIASASPLLLVIEDLQWADPSTVDLISAIARSRTSAKLMLLGTCRHMEAAPDKHPLKALKLDLLIHQLCRMITLGPVPQAA